jgi:hypothetical protein
MDLRKKKVNSASIVLFVLGSIFLLLVQLGFVSPSGLIRVTDIQYTWLFWISVVFFIVAAANLASRFPRYASWKTGYDGTVARTVKIAGDTREYFIRGAENETVRWALLENWPFEDVDKNANWHAESPEGNDVTDFLLKSIVDTVTVVLSQKQ